MYQTVMTASKRRTSIYMDDETLIQAEAKAADEGRSLSGLLVHLITDYLAKDQPTEQEQNASLENILARIEKLEARSK